MDDSIIETCEASDSIAISFITARLAYKVSTIETKSDEGAARYAKGHFYRAAWKNSIIKSNTRRLSDPPPGLGQRPGPIHKQFLDDCKMKVFRNLRWQMRSLRIRAGWSHSRWLGRWASVSVPSVWNLGRSCWRPCEISVKNFNSSKTMRRTFKYLQRFYFVSKYTNQNLPISFPRKVGIYVPGLGELVIVVWPPIHNSNTHARTHTHIHTYTHTQTHTHTIVFL